MKKVLSAGLFLLLSVLLFGQDIPLGEPPARLGVDLFEAIRLRTAARDFRKRDLPVADLSAILWAANGVRRGNDAVTAATKAARTIPYSGDNAYINVYILNERGVYRYVPEQNLLKQVGNRDVRAAVSPGNIANAAFMALFTIDASRAPSFLKGNAALLREMGAATAGFAAENMILAAAGRKLGSIVMWNIRASAASEAAKLAREETPVCILQVGYLQ